MEDSVSRELKPKPREEKRKKFGSNLKGTKYTTLRLPSQDSGRCKEMFHDQANLGQGLVWRAEGEKLKAARQVTRLNTVVHSLGQELRKQKQAVSFHR